MIKSGVDPAAILLGAQRYAVELSAKGQVGTPYVKQAIGWLNARLWEDYGAPPATGPPNDPRRFGWRPGLPTDEELRRKYANGSAGNQTADVAGVDEPGIRPGPDDARLV